MKNFISKFKDSRLLFYWTILVNIFLLIEIILTLIGIQFLMPLSFVIIFTILTNIKAYIHINKDQYNGL